ncbi:hypothetical protein C1645_27372 [Glomus cerebriforme]|uniref:Uncharacterized protein n=1 Tax=Glomus cerebriforme TaxID=658196 RepID=A0A397TAB3_9GLOM|nr:hypothetical protein C1645_27372 [Glomus cerebriforme]
MFETIILEYLDSTLSKDWSVLGVLEFARPKLSVDMIKEFKDDLYAILQRYSEKCNVHAYAKNKVKKILTNFDTYLSTVEVRKFINDLEFHAEMRVNVTSAYTVEVLKVSLRKIWKQVSQWTYQQFFRINGKNRELISQLRRNDFITGENSKEAGRVREKVTRPLETQDNHSCKRQCRQEQIPEYLAEVADDEPPIEWEFDTPRPSWLEKVVEERRVLTSNNDLTAKHESSLEPIWWRIVDLSDPKIVDILSETDLSDLSAIFSSALKNWTVLEPTAERCLQSLMKVDDHD